jgi:hypothetical protein
MCVGLKRLVRNSRSASRDYCRHLTNNSRDGCCRTLAAAHCFPVHNVWPAGHFSAGKDWRQKNINRLTSRCSFNCTYVRSQCGDSVSWTCIFSDSWQPCRQRGRERKISRISMSLQAWGVRILAFLQKLVTGFHMEKETSRSALETVRCFYILQ